VVLAAAAVALDAAARSAAQSAAARQVEASTGAASAQVSFGSEPFLWDALVDGKVQRVTVTADDVPLGPFTISRVRVSGTDVDFARNQLFNSHRMRVTYVGRATVVITPGLGLLGAAALEALDFARIPIVPDCPLALHRVSGDYDLTCTVAPAPASMLEAINSRA
jgi:hypothetical protein